MTLAVCFWVIMIVWVVFGFWSGLGQQSSGQPLGFRGGLVRFWT